MLYKPPRTALVRRKSCKTETPQVRNTGDFLAAIQIVNFPLRPVPDCFRVARDSSTQQAARGHLFVVLMKRCCLVETDRFSSSSLSAVVFCSNVIP